jgi:hypothetical protein
MEDRAPFVVPPVLLVSGTSEMISRYCLVWLRSHTGPAPQVWSPEYFAVYRKRSEPLLLSVRELTDAERREPLANLATKYPVTID